MAVSVRIEDEAFADARIELLGRIAGYNRYEALGRLAYLWRLCTQRNSYYLSDALVAATLGDRGIDGLLGSELGERSGDGTIRVCGTQGRIEWLAKLRANSKAGGRANRSQWQAKAEPVLSREAIQTDSQMGAKRAPIGSVDNYTGEPLGYPIGYPNESQMASQAQARRKPDAGPLPSPPIPSPLPIKRKIRDQTRAGAREPEPESESESEPSFLDSVRADPEAFIHTELEPEQSEQSELSRMAADAIAMLEGRKR